MIYRTSTPLPPVFMSSLTQIIKFLLAANGCYDGMVKIKPCREVTRRTLDHNRAIFPNQGGIPSRW